MRDAAFVRRVIDGETFMVLGTADEDGRPWASPVWFSHRDHREFVWVSDPDVQHSRNIAVRPEIAIVIFDSGQAPGTGHAVYLKATAGRSDEGLDIFNLRSVPQGLGEWDEARVTGDARLRLYRAAVTEWSVLRDDRDVRVPVALT